MSGKPTLQIISTLCVLLPLVLNGLKLRKAGTLGRLSFIFFLSGFLTDFVMGYLHLNEIEGISLHIFSVYSLGEALFFFWLIRYVGPTVTLKKVANYFLLAIPFFWLICQIPIFESGKTAHSIPFLTTYEVVVSFMAGFSLLSLAERNDKLLPLPEFWFVLGTFFYCFCTFFIMTLIGSDLSLNLWPLNNIVNILTSLLYSIGWWMFEGKETLHTTGFDPDRIRQKTFPE